MVSLFASERILFPARPAGIAPFDRGWRSRRARSPRASAITSGSLFEAAPWRRLPIG